MLDGRNNRFFFPWEQMFFLMQIIFIVLRSNMAAVQNLYYYRHHLHHCHYQANWPIMLSFVYTILLLTRTVFVPKFMYHFPYFISLKCLKFCSMNYNVTIMNLIEKKQKKLFIDFRFSSCTHGRNHSSQRLQQSEIKNCSTLPKVCIWMQEYRSHLSVHLFW